MPVPKQTQMDLFKSLAFHEGMGEGARDGARGFGRAERCSSLGLLLTAWHEVKNEVDVPWRFGGLASQIHLLQVYFGITCI